MKRCGICLVILTTVFAIITAIIWYAFSVNFYKINEAKQQVYSLEDSKTLCQISSLPFNVGNDIFITVNQSLVSLVRRDNNDLERYQKMYPFSSIETCYKDNEKIYLFLPDNVAERKCYTESIFIFACFFTLFCFLFFNLTYCYFKFYKSKDRLIFFIFRQLPEEKRLLNEKNEFIGIDIGSENREFKTFEFREVLSKIYSVM